MAVDPSHFIAESLLEEIIQEERELSDGTTALCYVIKAKSQPHEHEMGPWSPRTVTDGPEKGGIWFENGRVYDVDGPFVRNMAVFYNDPEWRLFREDGTIKITESKEAFLAAARPDVDPEYKNHVVEGKSEWFEGTVTTYVIPVKPIHSEEPYRFGHGAIGLAFNGVHYDPPAPTQAILEAHTLAPLDDAGGHLNPFEGYHYHAATGDTKEIGQDDGHAPQIGYALDGFPIFAHLDENGQASEGLDECGGHYDEVRGYHYHAGAPGDNQIFKAFRGIPGSYTTTRPEWVKEGENARGSGRDGRPPRGEGPPPHERPEPSTHEGQGAHSHPHTHDGEPHTHDGEPH